VKKTANIALSMSVPVMLLLWAVVVLAALMSSTEAVALDAKDVMVSSEQTRWFSSSGGTPLSGCSAASASDPQGKCWGAMNWVKTSGLKLPISDKLAITYKKFGLTSSSPMSEFQRYLYEKEPKYGCSKPCRRKTNVGAFNSTHADEKPCSDGKLWCTKAADTKYVKKHCNTQVSVTRWGKVERDLSTCTSCKVGYAFQFIHHKSRAGQCKPYRRVSQVWTARLNRDANASPHDRNTISTKTILARNTLNIALLRGNARKYYEKAKGLSGMGVTECAFRKETVCHERGSRMICRVKKQIHCLRVCKMKAWDTIVPNPDQKGKQINLGVRFGRCFPELCKGRHGELACQDAARSE
jgi:hypothetical protein